MTPRNVPTPRLIRLYVLCIETVLVAGMAGVVILAALQVLFRYGLGMSLSWSEEALRYLMIWIASLGLGLAYSRGEMIGMELLVSNLPSRAAIAVGIAGRVLVFAMAIAIVWYGWQFAWTTREATATAIPISMFWIHMSVATGSLLVALHVSVGAVGAMTAGRAPSEESGGSGRGL